MAYSFGNDILFLQMKEALASNDRERLAALLLSGIEPVIAMELRRSEVFGMFTAEDRKDATQEAWFYIFVRLEPFLNDPRNDPDCESEDRYTPARRQRWAHLMVGYAFLHMRDRNKKHAKSPGAHDGDSSDAGFPDELEGESLTMDSPGPNNPTKKPKDKGIPVISLDRYVADYENGTKVMDFISGNQAAPDEELLKRERMTQACRAFFDLKNSPELLAAVGFVILSESLTRTHRSLDAYANLLNGKPAMQVVASIERILDEFDIDPSALDKLKKRLAGDKMRTIDNLTAKSLANRKNSMLSTLRRASTDEEDKT